MATHRHSHPCQRHTTLEIPLLQPWHRPSLGPAQGPTPKRGPSLDQKRTPQTMSPHSGGTYFGGCKVHLQIGPYLAAIKRSLLLEISGRMSLLASTRQRSNGSDGDSGPAGQAVSQPTHGRCSHTLAIGRFSQVPLWLIFMHTPPVTVGELRYAGALS